MTNLVLLSSCVVTSMFLKWGEFPEQSVWHARVLTNHVIGLANGLPLLCVQSYRDGTNLVTNLEGAGWTPNTNHFEGEVFQMLQNFQVK